MSAAARLLCQPGENKHVCRFYGSLLSSSLLARTLPALGSVNSVHSEILQDSLSCLFSSFSPSRILSLGLLSTFSEFLPLFLVMENSWGKY